MHAALQVATGRWAERVGAGRFVVVFGQVLNRNFRSSTFFLGNFRSSTFFWGNECRFGRRRGARLGFTGSLGLPVEDRFPILCFLTIKFFFPLCSRQRIFGAMVVVLVAPRAAVRPNVVEQLALSIAGDLPAVDRGGRVGAFEARREAGGLLVGGAGIAGRVLAGL